MLLKYFSRHGKIHPESEHLKGLEAIRSHLVNGTLVIMSTVAWPGVLTSLLRISQTGWQDLMLLHIIIAVSFLVLLFLRKKLSYNMRVFSLLLLLYGTGVGAMMGLGLSGFGLTWLLVFCVLATVLVSVRLGLCALLLSVLSISLVGGGICSGFITPVIDYSGYATSPTSWIAASFVAAFQVGVVLYISGSIYQFMEQAMNKAQRRADELQLANEQLVGEIAARARLQKAIEQAKEGIVIVETDGKITYGNSAFAAITGFSKQEFYGEQAENIAHGGNKEEEFVRILEIIEEKKRWKGRLSNKRKDGTPYNSDTTLSSVEDEEGNVVNYVMIHRDVTSEVRLENQLAQSQKMEAVGVLAGGIAHDFNNILASMFGYTELAIMDVPEDSSVAECLDKILIAGSRAKSLVDQILTFSRLNKFEDTSVDLRIVTKEALQLLRASLPSTIELRSNIERVSEIKGDPTQMYQVVMNFCTNAAHAMPDGGKMDVELTNIEVGEEMAEAIHGLLPGTYTLLVVKDTGIGMEPQILSRIFEPFFTTKEEGVGTGMGLSVVHGIVTGVGGVILPYSEPGSGTIFKVYFPALEQRTASSLEKQEPLPRGSERLLVVDDEPSIVEACTKILQSLGYQVDGQTSSTVALEKFKSQPDKYDLLLTDMTMPGLTGEQLAAECMQIKSSLPVILCTGFSATINEKRALSLGFRALITKPVLSRELALAIRDGLDQVPPSTS